MLQFNVLLKSVNQLPFNRAKEGEDLNVFFGSEVLLSNIEVFNST